MFLADGYGSILDQTVRRRFSNFVSSAVPHPVPRESINQRRPEWRSRRASASRARASTSSNFVRVLRRAHTSAVCVCVCVWFAISHCWRAGTVVCVWERVSVCSGDGGGVRVRARTRPKGTNRRRPQSTGSHERLSPAHKCTQLRDGTALFNWVGRRKYVGNRRIAPSTKYFNTDEYAHSPSV